MPPKKKFCFAQMIARGALNLLSSFNFHKYEEGEAKVCDWKDELRREQVSFKAALCEVLVSCRSLGLAHWPECLPLTCLMKVACARQSTHHPICPL